MVYGLWFMVYGLWFMVYGKKTLNLEPNYDVVLNLEFFNAHCNRVLPTATAHCLPPTAYRLPPTEMGIIFVAR